MIFIKSNYKLPFLDRLRCVIKFIISLKNQNGRIKTVSSWYPVDTARSPGYVWWYDSMYSMYSCMMQYEIWKFLKVNILQYVAVRTSSFVFKIDTSVLVYLHELTLIPVWISNHMLSKMWDEIAYPLTNLSDVWQWINNLIQHFIMNVITYPCCD